MLAGCRRRPTVHDTVRAIEALVAQPDLFPLHQRPWSFRNFGDGRFEDVSGRAGAVLIRSTVARGAAFGNVDNDGDIDMLAGNNNGPAELLVNQTGQRNPRGDAYDALSAKTAARSMRSANLTVQQWRFHD